MSTISHIKVSICAIGLVFSHLNCDAVNSVIGLTAISWNSASTIGLVYIPSIRGGQMGANEPIVALSGFLVALCRVLITKK